MGCKVWFDLVSGTAWRSSVDEPSEQAVKSQAPENAQGWSSMIGGWRDGWRQELAEVSVGEYQRRPVVESSASPPLPHTRGGQGALEASSQLASREELGNVVS